MGCSIQIRSEAHPASHSTRNGVPLPGVKRSWREVDRSPLQSKKCVGLTSTPLYTPSWRSQQQLSLYPYSTDSGFRGCAAMSSETTRPEARRHVPKALNPQKHRCENLKPCTLIYKYKNLLHIFVCFTHTSLPCCYNNTRR
jgi:hypothetical protein